MSFTTDGIDYAFIIDISKRTRLERYKTSRDEGACLWQLDIYMSVDSDSMIPSRTLSCFFYGGNWNSGSRSQYGFVDEALASRGIMAVVADYWLLLQVVYPGFIEDTAQAVSWALKHIIESV